MRRGATREGAGKKPGSVNRKTREIAEKAVADGITPLEIMVQATREVCEKEGTVAAYALARDCAPFLPPRRRPIEAEGLNPTQRDTLRRVLDEFDDPQAEKDW
jgi:hypothetical protein